MSDLDFEQRHRLETEVLPAVINDPEYAAATIVRLEAQVAALEKDNDDIHELAEYYRVENGRLQAKIDRLMFEYCPDEMTRAQVEEFQRHQGAALGSEK